MFKSMKKNVSSKLHIESTHRLMHLLQMSSADDTEDVALNFDDEEQQQKKSKFKYVP